MNKPDCEICPIAGMDRKQKRAIVEATIRQHPQDSARAIAARLAWLGVDDKTVGKYRDRLVATAEIPQFATLRGRDGKRRRSARKDRNIDPVYSCQRSDNDELMANVARLYFRQGDKIADVTYGRGAMWAKIDTEQYEFYKSDISCPDAPYDFTCLPYPNDSFDVILFDPPYVTHGAVRDSENQSYMNWIKTRYKVDEKNQAVSSMDYADLIELFHEGIEECSRVVTRGGLVLVKCCDEATGGIQRMTHITVHDMAVDLGLIVKDLFILHRRTDPQSFGKQQHARKNHSYLWVFTRP